MNIKFLRNTIVVMISNSFVLLSGIAVGVLLPRIMTVSEYGYYKIFTLYLTYAGLTHLGFPNGVYLDYSGMNYSDLQTEKFVTYFRYFIVEQIIASVVMVGILTVLNHCGIKNVITGRMLLFILLESFLMNVINYFQLISQAVQKFKQLSIMNTVKSVLFLLAIIYLSFLVKQGVMDKVAADNYIYLYIMISVVLIIFYLIFYKNICFGKSSCMISCVNEIIAYHKKGIHLLISGIVATIIFTLDRQFVSVLFDVKIYGTYSFAYSILNIISTIVGSIAIVVYPTLKTLKKDEMMNKYSASIEYLSLAVSVTLALYYPFKNFLFWFLPDYACSIDIFRIILPGICISNAISIVISNYYKALGEMNSYSIICICVLLISVINNIVAYGLFRTPTAISAASVLTMVLWYILSERYLYKKYGLSGKNGLKINVAALIMFYLSTFISNYFGMIIYIMSVISEILIYKHLRRKA